MKEAQAFLQNLMTIFIMCATFNSFTLIAALIGKTWTKLHIMLLVFRPTEIHK